MNNGTQQRIKNNCHMPIKPRAVARININDFESFETRNWQLFLCKRYVQGCSW